MGTEIDELVTKLSYVLANPKVIDEAEKSVDDLSKSNEEAAKTTDALSKEQLELAGSLDTAQTKTKSLTQKQRDLKREIRIAGKATKTQKIQLLSLENQINGARIATERLQTQSRKLGRQKAKVSIEARKLSRDQRKLAAATQRARAALNDETTAAKGTGDALSRLKERAAGVAVGQLAADAIRSGTTALFEAGKQVVTTGTEFESLRARLKTVEGSADGAAIAFAKIQEFAAKTPFQVQNLTEAFTQLRVRGVDPTADKLTALGDLSSAFGQDFTQVTDAIGAASRGELDSIEKFGITAKIAGDKISLSFKGQTTEVERSATAVTDALVAFGKMEGVQGAMAAQSKTLGGQFSNLQDSIASFLDLIANLGVMDEMRLIVAELGDTMDADLAQVIADVLVGALRALRGVFVALKGDGDGISTTFKSFVEILKLLANAVKILFAVFFPFSLFFKQLAPLLLTIFNLIGKVAEGINNLIGFLTRLIAVAFQPIKDLFALIKEFIQLLGVWVDEWMGVGETWQRVKDIGDKILGTITNITGAMDDQASATNAARKALVELGAEEDKRRAKQIQQQQLEATASEAQGGTQGKAQQARTAKQASAAAERLDKLNDTQLSGFIADPNVSPKLRKKAQKEQTRRAKSKDKKRRSAGAKAAKEGRKNLVTTQISEQIAERAKDAGKRAAARALIESRRGGGEVDQAAINQIQRDEQKRVKAKLTARFEKTGELPAGISSDLSQIARTPGIEAAGGRVAPPVISNTFVRIVGTVFNINTSVEGTTASAQDIATANVTGIRNLTPRDIGDAIFNAQTQERR